MDNQEKIKKSSLYAEDTYDYQKLMADTFGLLPCEIEETGEELMITYHLEGKKPLSELEKEDRDKKYQFLINLILLDKTWKAYRFSMTSDNLWYDENYLPYVKRRDIYEKGTEPDEKKFLESYQTVVSGILGGKYSIQQIEESGLEILREEKGFQEILDCKSPDEVSELLREKRKVYLENEKRKQKKVSKKAWIGWKIAAVFLGSGFLCTAAFSVYAGVFQMPEQKAVIDAHEAYVKKDYVQSIDSMQGISPEDMDAGTRYILAVAYASSESFRKEEIQNIIDKLSPTSNEKELDYWIYLGRLNLEKAEELAMSLSDDKLLVYAYMKEADLLESDNTINGEEKKTRLDTLEQEIEKIGKKYTEETE